MSERFSPRESEIRRDAGMALARAAQHCAAPTWADQAYAAIRAIAARQDDVFVDDVLGDFALRPAHPNAWGHVWQRAIRDGLLMHSGRVRASADPKKHKHQYPVYRSLIAGRAAQRQDARP